MENILKQSSGFLRVLRTIRTAEGLVSFAKNDQQVNRYSMLPSFRTGPVFVQKELYLIIFVGRLNLRQPKNSKNKRNISAINCRVCRTF